MSYFKSKEEKEQVIYSDTYKRILDFMKLRDFIKQEINDRKDVEFIEQRTDRFILKDLKNNLYIVIHKDLIEILDNYNFEGKIALIVNVLEYYRVDEEELKGEVLHILDIIEKS